MKDNNTFKVLLVEDNPGDILLVKETILEDNSSSIQLDVITNGEDALNFLFNTALPDSKSRPGLIILDLNLPKKSGKEILEQIHTVKELCKIPVIILTSADIDDDVFTNGKYNIKYYLLKPIELEEYLDVICFIKNYINTLISNSSNEK